MFHFISFPNGVECNYPKFNKTGDYSKYSTFVIILCAAYSGEDCLRSSIKTKHRFMRDLAFKRMSHPAGTMPCDNLQHITDLQRVSLNLQVKLYHTTAKEIWFGCICSVKMPVNLKFGLRTQSARTRCVQQYSWSTDIQQPFAYTTTRLKTMTFRRNCDDKDASYPNNSIWKGWPRTGSTIGYLDGI